MTKTFLSGDGLATLASDLLMHVDTCYFLLARIHCIGPLCLALSLVFHRDPLLFVRSSTESVDVWWQLLIARRERKNMQISSGVDGTTLVGVAEINNPKKSHLKKKKSTKTKQRLAQVLLVLSNGSSKHTIASWSDDASSSTEYDQ